MSVRSAVFATLMLGGLGVGSAQAATLTATTLFPIGGNGSFVIEFDDLNGNSLFDISELASFSGFLSFFGQDIVRVIGVPEISGISVAGTVFGATGLFSSFLNFEENGLVDLKADLSASVNNWSYEITGLNTSPVPLPAALPFLASGLGALGLLGWRRRKCAAA